MGEAKTTIVRSWRIKLVVAFFIVVSAVSFNAAFNTQNSMAASCDPSRYGCNGPEVTARDICAGDPSASGAMWFNTSDGSATDTGYYAATVNIDATASSVRVNLRGSVNACNDGSSYNVYAVGISPQGSEGGRLTGLSSTTLFRGYMSGARYTWSSQGDTIGADLNVSGLATNNQGRTDAQSITIDIYRCFSTNGSSPTGSCYATPVIVNIVRAAGLNFDLNPTITGTPSYMDSGSTAGNSVSLTPNVNNTGSTSSSNAQWRVVAFKIAPSAGIPGGGVGGALPETYFGNGATLIGNGSQVFSQGVSPTLGVSPQTIGDLPIGTRVCYALSVQPVTQNNGSWRYSTPFCVTIGKSPKVQVHGGDLLVGRLFAGATVPVPSSKVQTSITKKADKFVTTPTPQTAFTGLWKTGVDNAGQKLPGNVSDPHWIIDRVVRPPGRTENTCQKAMTSTGLRSIPKTSVSPIIPGRTVTENGSGNRAGIYTDNDHGTTGSPVHPNVVGLNGQYVWDRTSPGARWIGQNQYGQNYSEASCLDPTYVSQNTDIGSANIYVFKLKDGFTIDPTANVNLDTAKIRIEGGVDNQVMFYVNGQSLGDWQSPGWNAASVAISENKANVFKNGQNSLEVWVKSTYSHTGLLVDKIQVIADSVQVQASTFGSWAEYGILPVGTVKNMASASAYAGGSASIPVCSAAFLTFSNTPNTSSCSASTPPLGGYKTNRSIPDVGAYFPTSSTTPNLSGTVSLSGLNGTYTANSNVTISDSTIAPGKSVIINAPANTVTIQKDIKYATSPLTSAGQIPQVIIIAKDIRIQGDVTQIDSWLIGNNSVNTCVDVLDRTKLTTGTCNKRLTVNGPVMAGKLYLWRTAGSGDGAAASDPAEVFNLRPDAYLWGLSKASASGRLTTVYERELPPRY